MCNKCDFANSIVDSAQEHDLNPDELMTVLTGLIRTATARLTDKEEKTVLISVYTSEGDLLSVMGSEPYLSDEAQYKLNQNMIAHNKKTDETVTLKQVVEDAEVTVH